MSQPVYKIGGNIDTSKKNTDNNSTKNITNNNKTENQNQNKSQDDKKSKLSSKTKSNLPEIQSNLDSLKTQNIENIQKPKEKSAEDLEIINYKNQIEELDKNLHREKEKYDALNGLLLLERSNSQNLQHEINLKNKYIFFKKCLFQ